MARYRRIDEGAFGSMYTSNHRDGLKVIMSVNELRKVLVSRSGELVTERNGKPYYIWDEDMGMFEDILDEIISEIGYEPHELIDCRRLTFDDVIARLGASEGVQEDDGEKKVVVIRRFERIGNEGMDAVRSILVGESPLSLAPGVRVILMSRISDEDRWTLTKGEMLDRYTLFATEISTRTDDGDYGED